jgi:hypothetical protein
MADKPSFHKETVVAIAVDGSNGSRAAVQYAIDNILM